MGEFDLAFMLENESLVDHFINCSIPVAMTIS